VTANSPKIVNASISFLSLSLQRRTGRRVGGIAQFEPIVKPSLIAAAIASLVVGQAEMQ
jgi:hypothetical protein